MPDTSLSLSHLLTQIEGLLVQGEPDAMLDTCYFGVRLGHDSGRLVLRILPTSESAHHTFAIDGNQFVAPQNWTTGSFRRQGDGTITDRTSYPRPEPKPPSVSNESVPDLGDENHLWRSHGVIKMRVGRFLADVKLPTDGDAERLARRLADMLRAGEGFAEVPEDR